MSSSPDVNRPTRRLSRRARLATFASALVLLAGGVLGVGAFQPAASDDAKPSANPGAKPAERQAARGSLTADRAVAQRISFEITTTVAGELEAKNQIELRSRLEKRAQIVEIVPEGSRVKAGDVLIRLNTDQLESDLQEALLRVETAKAQLIAAENAYSIQLSENDSKLRQAEVKEALAELALKKWIAGDLESDRLKNRLAVEKATRELSRLQEKLDQSKQLYERKFLSLDELKQDELRVLEARAALDTANLSADVYETYTVPKDERTKVTDLYDAQAEVERVMLNNERQLASKEADRNNQRTQLQLHETKLANLREQLANCIMTAPTDGLAVYASSMERNRWSSDGPLAVGREVNPNEALMALPDTSQMVASVRVQEALASRIQPGQQASIKVDAAGGRVFTGRVESISVLAENGGWRDPNLREYTVKVALTEDDVSMLKPSMRCEGQIVLGRVDDANAVPVQAVFNDGAVRYVYTPRGMKFQRVPVRLGRRSDTMAEILAGVPEGQVVLLRQPEAGEILAEPWDQTALAAAGYKLNEQGVPVAVESDGPPNRAPRGPKLVGRPGAKPAAKPETPAPATNGTAPATGEQSSTQSGASETKAAAGNVTK
jgi:HlyD family secretion protein